LHEPDDMAIVLPPCHPWEPLKVPLEVSRTIYCLLCGSTFGV
jgi:hypothetical protein